MSSSSICITRRATGACHLIRSPFRFLPTSGEADAAIASAWSAVRVLDTSELKADLQTDLNLIHALPQLPALRYVMLPSFDDLSDTDPVAIDGVFRGLSSCPALTGDRWPLL